MAEDAVIRVRGLPWEVTVEDLSQFFSGYQIATDGILIVRNRQGRSTGEAFVTFVNPQIASEAMSKDRGLIGRRPVEVAAPGIDAVIRMRGLPFSATASQIVEFFQPIPMGEQQVTMVPGSDGRNSGEAFVIFADGAQVEMAMSKNKAHLGSRYVELFRSNMGEMQHILRSAMYGGGRGGYDSYRHNAYHHYGVAPVAYGGDMYGAGQGQGYGYGYGYDAHVNTGVMVGEHEFTAVKLKGLPFSATEADIQNFFAGLRIAPNGIHIMYNHQGRPAGDAFVEFVSAEDSAAAMSRNRQHMGSRYIQVIRMSRIDMMAAIGNEYAPMGAYGAAPSGYTASTGSGVTVRARGLPFTSTVYDVVQFFDGFNVTADSVSISTNQSGRPSGEAFIVFSSPEEAQRAIRERNRASIGSRYIELFLV
eukprot:Colp12_sorted_trinity150504_noHs@3152